MGSAAIPLLQAGIQGSQEASRRKDQLESSLIDRSTSSITGRQGQALAEIFGSDRSGSILNQGIAGGVNANSEIKNKEFARQQAERDFELKKKQLDLQKDLTDKYLKSGGTKTVLQPTQTAPLNLGGAFGGSFNSSAGSSNTGLGGIFDLTGASGFGV